MSLFDVIRYPVQEITRKSLDAIPPAIVRVWWKEDVPKVINVAEIYENINTRYKEVIPPERIMDYLVHDVCTSYEGFDLLITHLKNRIKEYEE